MDFENRRCENIQQNASAKSPEKWIAGIDLDLPRTRAGDAEVVESLPRVRTMLVQHVSHDTELGYCQGMSFVAAAFAVSPVPSSEDRFGGATYVRYRRFMARTRGLWLAPDFPLLAQGTDHFIFLARDRPWFRALEEHDVEPSMFLPQAWQAFFGSWLSLPVLKACMPFLEREGFEGMLALTLSILDRARRDILEQRDLQQLLFLLRDLHASAATSRPLALRARSRYWLHRIRRARLTKRQWVPRAAACLQARPAEAQLDCEAQGAA